MSHVLNYVKYRSYAKRKIPMIVYFRETYKVSNLQVVIIMEEMRKIYPLVQCYEIDWFQRDINGIKNNLKSHSDAVCIKNGKQIKIISVFSSNELHNLFQTVYNDCVCNFISTYNKILLREKLIDVFHVHQIYDIKNPSYEFSTKSCDADLIPFTDKIRKKEIKRQSGRIKKAIKSQSTINNCEFNETNKILISERQSKMKNDFIFRDKNLQNELYTANLKKLKDVLESNIQSNSYKYSFNENPMNFYQINKIWKKNKRIQNKAKHNNLLYSQRFRLIFPNQTDANIPNNTNIRSTLDNHMNCKYSNIQKFNSEINNSVILDSFQNKNIYNYTDTYKNNSNYFLNDILHNNLSLNNIQNEQKSVLKIERSNISLKNQKFKIENQIKTDTCQNISFPNFEDSEKNYSYITSNKVKTSTIIPSINSQLLNKTKIKIQDNNFKIEQINYFPDEFNTKSITQTQLPSFEETFYNSESMDKVLNKYKFSNNISEMHYFDENKRFPNNTKLVRSANKIYFDLSNSSISEEVNSAHNVTDIYNESIHNLISDEFKSYQNL